MTQEEMKARDSAPRMVRVYDRRDIKPGTAFRTSDGSVFFNNDGMYVRVNKDRRNHKEIKRARRAARVAAQGATVERSAE